MERRRRKQTTLTVICRKVSQNTGEVAVYPVNMAVSEMNMALLEERALLNPELRYFVLTTVRWKRFRDIITGILKRRTVTQADIDRIGGMIEL